MSSQTRRRSTPKVSCEQCYFRCNLLCALSLAEPCSTFRPNEAQLKPPQQLRLIFRDERRSCATALMTRMRSKIEEIRAG